jgi:hypothetical protein
MKTADIKVGDHYAIADNYDWKINWARWSGEVRKAERVEVLATKAPRRFMPRDSYHLRTKADGVHVRYVGGPRDGQTKVIHPAQVRQPWTVYETEEAARQQTKREEAQSEAADRDQTLGRIRTALGPDINLPEWVSSMPRGGINRTELAILLEAAHERGKHEARAALLNLSESTP